MSPPFQINCPTLLTLKLAPAPLNTKPDSADGLLLRTGVVLAAIVRWPSCGCLKKATPEKEVGWLGGLSSAVGWGTAGVEVKMGGGAAPSSTVADRAGLPTSGKELIRSSLVDVCQQTNINWTRVC